MSRRVQDDAANNLVTRNSCAVTPGHFRGVGTAGSRCRRNFLDADRESGEALQIRVAAEKGTRHGYFFTQTIRCVQAHNNEKVYADAATYLRTALLLGLIAPEEAIAWADRVIHEDPAPPALIFTLSLTAPELSAAREALRPLASPTESPRVIEAVLGLAARDLSSGRRNVDDTLRVLSQLRRFVKLDAHLDEEIKELVAEHMLASAGIEPQRLEGIRARIAALVDNYAGVSPLVTPRRDLA